jgi:hypothetical protein
MTDSPNKALEKKLQPKMMQKSGPASDFTFLTKLDMIHSLENKDER